MRERWGADQTLTGLKPFMTFGWEHQYANTLDGAAFEYAIYSGPIRLPGSIPPFKEGHRMQTGKYTYELWETGGHGYVSQSSTKQNLSETELAESLIKFYLSVAEKLENREK